MKPKLMISVLAIALIAAAVLMARPRPDTPQVPDEKTEVSVRMKWFFAGTMAGWFAGREQGIFDRHGINLTITPGGPDNNSVKLVAAGSDMFGIAGADEVLLARGKGIPIVAIGVLFKDSPICFISKRGKGISAPTDWAGKTVEVSYGSNAEVQYRAMVAKYGVRNITEVPYTFNLAPFIEDRVDVSVAYKMDQVVTLERRGIALETICAKEHGINPYGDVVITTETTLRDKPDLVRRFMTAVVESHQWAVENTDTAVSNLVSTANGLSFDNERSVWLATIPFLTAQGSVAEIGRMSPERWGDTHELMLTYGGLDPKTPLGPSYQQVVH